MPRARTKFLPDDPTKRIAMLEAWAVREKMLETKAELEQLQLDWEKAVRDANKAGVSPTILAGFLGITRGRIHQILRKKPSRP